jgi:hypothetical protein
LPLLRSLSISGEQVLVEASLGKLSALTHLSLGAYYSSETCGTRCIACQPECLPPQLQQLELTAFDPAAFPLRAAPAGAAGSMPLLLSLSLARPGDGWQEQLPSWDWLSLQTRLTSLSLNEWPMGALPRQLGALTQLQELSVAMSDLTGSVQVLQPLSGLLHLTKLDLSSNEFRDVPPFVFALPALKVCAAAWLPSQPFLLRLCVQGLQWATHLPRPPPLLPLLLLCSLHRTWGSNSVPVVLGT